MSRFSSSLLALSLFACNNGELGEDNVELEWNAGEMFYIGATYRIANVKGETNNVDLEGNAAPDFGEAWSDEVLWTYQVVETGLIPQEGDELYEYALTPDGVTSLTVIRAYIEESLNFENDLAASDPVIYLVFREDRDRLAAVISFVDVEGERVQQAWSSKDLDKSYGTLSQSMITAAPTYLAPFTAKARDADVVLENGSLLTTVDNGDGTVDAYFDDEIGGGLVMTRYEEGQPWPTITMTDNVEARLLSLDEVSARRATGPFLLDEPPPDFDYRAALRAAIDLDRSLKLSEEEMNGGWEDAAYEGYRPWAGSWWALSKAELVFGYESDRETISGLVKDDIHDLKVDMDRLSEEIREMEDGPDKDAKIDEYKAKQDQVVETLVEFYDGIRQDLDGGLITIADGTISHSEDGWSFEIEELSPMDKFALHRHLAGDGFGNPFYGPAWEILNQYNPVGGSWWGHCNGWAAAAILTREPREPVTVTVDGVDIEYTTGDLKGLLTETHYSTYSNFYGSRYYKEGDDITDLTPKAFHQIIQFYIRDQGVPLVFDTTAAEEVWNFPAWGAEVRIQETTDPSLAGRININTADVETLQTVTGIGEAIAKRIVDYRRWEGPFQSVDDLLKIEGIGRSTLEAMRDEITVDAHQREFSVTASVRFTTDGVSEDHVDVNENEPRGFTETYRYTLVTDADGVVVEGTWEDERNHPDFAWIPYHNPTQASTQGSENPYVPYGSFLSLVTDQFTRE